MITDCPDQEFLPPIRLLAVGAFPAYIISDLQEMGIQSHWKIISAGLIKHAMSAFRQHIWIPRCNNNADKEKRLGITYQDKRHQTPSRPTNTRRLSIGPD